MQKWQSAALLLISLAVGATLGWYGHAASPELYKGGILRQSNTPFKYIGPLLACDVGSQESFPEFAPLRSQLDDLIHKKIAQGDAQHISVYVRSMRSARWFEINPSNTFAPASLLKVFVMMAYYKEADDSDNPGLLDKQITFEGSADPAADDPGQIIPHLTNGQAYSISRIIKQMIVYSDNDALNTLVDNFDPQTMIAFQNIFLDLNIPSPVTQSESALNFMTVDNYAMVFRVLYGSTYLSNRYSEQALTMLTQAQYKGGIVAGVPASMAVAHKFGVTTIPSTATSASVKELHDCGIIYYPEDHPYLLCVMTEGQDFAGLQQSIKDISSTTYVWLNDFYTHFPGVASTTMSVVRS